MRTSINARLNYDNARKALYTAFGGDNGAKVDLRQFKLTQSYIRLEQPLAVGQTSYTFPVLVNQGAPFNTEQRLNLQDSFVISEVGFYLALPSGATDATFPLLTDANPFIFTNFAQLRTFYNGQMRISVNNNVIVPAWDLMRHKVIPQTQQTAAFGAASPLTEFEGDGYGMYPMEPNVTFVGSKNYQVTVTLPASPTAVDANSRAVLLFRGILAQNSTVVS